MAATTLAQDLLPRDNGIFTYHRYPRYRPSEASPIRTLAYVVHPIGWLLREGIYRPMSAFAGGTNFTRSFFGFREPFDFREPECFSSSDAVPDCRQLPPLTNIGKYRDAQPLGDDAASMESMESERQVFFPDVNFDFDKSNLNDLGRGRVRQIAQLLASVPSLTIVVEGHADYKGTDEYNLGLGERRAQSVIAELGELGIDPSRLSPVSYGEGKPVFTEEEDWARAVNRRVQFSVKGAEQAPAQEEVEEAAAE
jgi:peptidoglycan-associated lipoprotein